MKPFKKGDIVKMKLLGDAHYYMVTEILGQLVEDGEFISADYEIMLLFPISKTISIENMIHEELEEVAGYESRDYELIMDYIIKERNRQGIFTFPKKIEDIALGVDNTSIHKDKTKAEPTKQAIEPKEAKPSVKAKKVEKKFGMNEIDAILKDTTLQDKMDLNVEKMDAHLELLSKAIKEDNLEEIESNKKALEEIRQTLMELEYFQLEVRRKGYSLRTGFGMRK